MLKRRSTASSKLDRRWRPLWAALASLAWTVPVVAQTPRTAPVPRAIREPIRLTAGESSDLMGVLTPDEKALYFVSDDSGTMDLMLQAPVQSGPVVFSSGLGDAAWPQISPDGQHIAYLYFDNDSTGDVCVRRTADRDAEQRHCLTGSDSAELQVAWWDNTSLAVLSRRELHGDFVLWRMALDGGVRRLVLARNMISLALSPDRRWLAYIPVNRAGGDVGVTFSQRTGLGIGLERIDGDVDGGAPTPYVPPLPGVTGAVAFTADSKHLLFTQFLNDTNGDGVIDGNDNAVIFRVPFAGHRLSPISGGVEPEQLTSARWDCHYPMPSKSRLIISCSHEGSFDVYALPLEGAVPRDWSDARLAAEVEVARDLWARLLLQSRRLGLATEVSARDAILIDMIALHLELGEHEAAIYYAERRLKSARVRPYGQLLVELARHRRADLALIHGETSEVYIRQEQARAEALRSKLGAAPSRLAALARLIISEIEDDIGDKAAALATFRGLALDSLDEPHLVGFAARRAERLYRHRADRQGLLEVYERCASLARLSVHDRLDYAQRYVSELGRGRGRQARQAATAEARARVYGESELGLLLDVEKALLALDDSNQEAVRAELIELYRKNEDPARRRALVLSALQGAAKVGNEYLQYELITTWVSSLGEDDPERKNAEALYDKVVLDRAYGEIRQGKLSKAREYFYDASVATGSLEAHVGFIEARLGEGGADARRSLDEVYAKHFARDPRSPVRRFAEAYRIARELPRQMDLVAHERDVERVVETLASVADELPNQPQVHQLWGFAQHQRSRRTGSSEAAVAANRQYLLAVDLARDDPRLSAPLQHRLGLLQAALGSHGAALLHFEKRDETPHLRPRAELGFRLARARSAWHRDDAEQARDQVLLAEQLATEPDLERYQPLVLDRLALSLVATGDRAAALQRYIELSRRAEREPHATPRINQLKIQVGIATNALASGKPKAALAALDRADRLLASDAELEPEPRVVYNRSLIGDYRYSALQYRALIAGLRARALDVQPAALDALQRRAELLERRVDESEADEDRLELAQADHHLARMHYRLGDVRAAARAVERGLEQSDQFNDSTDSEVNDAELALLRDYAELHLYGGLPRSELRRDLARELGRVYAIICERRNPRWAEQRFMFKTYIAQLAVAREAAARPKSRRP